MCQSGSRSPVRAAAHFGQEGSDRINSLANVLPVQLRTLLGFRIPNSDLQSSRTETGCKLQRNFQRRKRGGSRFQPYLTRGLRSSLIFLRVTTLTLASGSLLGGVSLRASNSFFWRALGSGTWRATTRPLE